jgi:hypothetical protein
MVQFWAESDDRDDDFRGGPLVLELHVATGD